jgi:hypothetical protein
MRKKKTEEKDKQNQVMTRNYLSKGLDVDLTLTLDICGASNPPQCSTD